ncbi:MAG: T9SS type A sorting domain-containing protein, partial [Bacteroidetes bacterium]|nr:T9SS type A sorting domain-containing protein [Bacteroidota bacterium]
ILLSRKAPQGLIPSSAERMEVFPNPFGTVLNIRGTELRSCRLLFPDGRTPAIHSAEQGQCTLDTKSLPSGIYILEIRSAEGIRTLRVMRAE